MPDTVEERLRRLRAQQGGPIEKRLLALRAQQRQPQQPSPEGVYDRVKRNLGVGAAGGYLGLTRPVEAAGGIVAGVLTGDFQPFKELGKGVALRAGQLYAATQPGGGAAASATGAAIDQAAAEREARQFQQGNLPVIQRTVRQAQLDKLAALDPSLSGKMTRGLVSGAIQSAPYFAAGPGGPLALAATGAAMELDRPENIPISATLGAAPIPIGQVFKAGLNAVRRALGKGAAQIIEAEAAPAAREIAPAVGEAVSPAPAASLDSAFAKLETDNVEQIGAMIANANRRLKKSATAAERQSSIEDYNRLNQLTSDEHRALSQVLPARSYEPILPDYPATGGYSRSISDIPAGEPNAQLDANLRELEQFFGAEGAAAKGPSVSAAPSISAASPSVRAAGASITGPSVSAPLDALNVAVSTAAQSVPKPAGQRILSELAAIYHLPRTLLSSLDLSAPFRQGALLTVPPTQWGRAARAGVRMFQALKTKNYEQIAGAIAAHADAPVADDAGLYLATKAKEGLQGAEEAFLSKYAGRIPLVKQSEQAYKTYLDSLRMDTFAKYKRVIDSQGLTAEQAQNAYKAAATWINYATGRGSLGQTVDRAFPALSTVIFSPRYLASRLNVLNPAYYAKNAATPEGRAVLKQQMSELVQYAGMVAGTMALAKAAGADVGLSPNSPDFLKIKAGRWRYDTLAGLQQVMRLVYRAGGDIKSKLQGEKTQGPNALEISGNFLRSKLAPAPAAFVDFIKGRTVTGKPFSAGEATVRLIAPIQWADFVEAYQKEGFGGVAKSSPGFFGFGVQDYDSTPVNAAIERSRPLFTELQRLNTRVSDLRKKDGEKDDAFNARVQQFSANYTRFGQELLNNPRFQAAPDNIKALALDALNNRAKALTNRELAFPDIELDPNFLMDAAENSKKNPANK